MKATSLAVTAMAMACSVLTASVAADNSSTGANKTQQPTIQSSPECQAAEDQFREYQEAYDRGDAKALASFYAEDVDYIDQDGAETKGRGEMEKLFMENFQAWDPDRQEIRSWIFDSNGGFGESSWSNESGHWLIRASNVLPDGSRSTSENVLTKVDNNQFTWESQNRTLDGESQPSFLKVVVRRTTTNP